MSKRKYIKKPVVINKVDIKLADFNKDLLKLILTPPIKKEPPPEENEK